MLERKKPLRSRSSLGKGAGPQRSGLSSGNKPLTTRKPLQGRGASRRSRNPIPRDKATPRQNPMRSSRPKTSAQERDCRELVHSRSRGRCELCARQGVPLEKAHRVGRSQSGLWVPSNILDLCHRCHTWNHAHPTIAYESGWHLRHTADALVEPVLLTKIITPEHLCQPTASDGWDPRTLPLVMAVLDDEGGITWLDEECSD